MRSSTVGLVGYLLLMFWVKAAQGQSSADIDLQSWDRSTKELKGSFRVLPEPQKPEEFLQKLPQLPLDYAAIDTTFSQLKLKQRTVQKMDRLAFAVLLKNVPKGVYGLRLRVDTAAEAYVIPVESERGPIQRALSVGIVGVDAASSVPEVADRLGRFQVETAGDYWLLINVANYHYKDGVVWKRPMIGDFQAMQRSWLLEILQEVFVLGIIVILTIYNAALFINRPEDPSNLWLAGYCVFALLRFISISAVILPIIFQQPSIQLHSILRIMEIGFSPISAACFINFAISNFSSWDKWRFKSRIFLVGGCLFAFVAVLIPTKNLPDLIIPLDIFAMTSGFISIYLIVQAIRLKMTGSTTFLMGAAVFVCTIVHDILCGLNIISSPIYLSNYGLAVLIFFQGQVVAKLFAKAFRTAQLLSAHLEEEVDRKTRDIQSMLDNIPLGICSIDADSKILPNFSSLLPDVIGVKDPAGRNFADTIFAKTNLSSDQKDTMLQSLKASFGEHVINFDVNAGHLPQEVALDYAGAKHYLQCIWSPITDKMSHVARILLVLRDITTLKQAEAQGLAHQLELEYIIELVSVSTEKFQSFYVTSMQFLSENDRLIRQNTKKDNEIVKIIFVNMHTIKGAARTLGFYKMTSLLHDVEQGYSNLLKDPQSSWQQAKLLDEMAEVKKVFDYYVRLNHEKLGRVAMNTTEVSISRDTLEEHNRVLRSIPLERLEPQDARKFRAVVNRIEDLCFSEASDVFLDILSNVQRVAKDLGKEIPIINVEAQGFKLKQSAHELLSKAFVHIIRNSLDHGIETAAERVAVGKRPTGRIDVYLSQQGEHLAIRYHDDGRGLDLKRLREKAQRDQLLLPEELNDRLKVANLIFLPGLSTAKSISEVSGRGIGMDAMKRYLESEGGQISLQLGEETNGFVSFDLNLLLDSSLFIKADQESEAVSIPA